MEKVMDKQIELDGVIIPFCEEGGENYYPIRYVTEKFLMKTCLQLQKNDNYKPYISRQVIDYTFKGTVPQETYCMNKDGWVKFLSERKLNKNKDINKIKRHNMFCDYFECEDNKYIDQTENPVYDDYIKDCINNVLEDNKYIEFRKCPQCGRDFPIHGNFFPCDKRVPSGFTGVCRMCKPSMFPIMHIDTYARRVYSLYGNDAYLMYVNDTSKFIEEYSNKKDFSELCLHTNTTAYIKIAEKDALLNLIKSDFDNGIITVSELNVDFSKANYKVKIKYNNLTNNEINEFVSDNDCKIRPWLYPYYKLGAISLKEGFNILKTYIEDNQIEINNILEYTKYEQMLKDSKLTQFISRKSVHNISSLEFIVKYYNNAYAGYKFKLKSANYYKEKDNMIFDMKWYIENDLKIAIEKIPLYVTKWSLHQNASPLYNALYKKNEL